MVDLFSSFNDFVSGLAILIGGSWAFRKYVLRKEDHPKIDFSVDIRKVGGRGSDGVVVELLGIVENKGDMPHTIKSMSFDLRKISASTSLEFGGGEIQKQLFFEEFLPQTTWLSEAQRSGSHAVLYPSLTMRFNHVTLVPRDVEFLLLHGNLSLNGRALKTVSDKAFCMHEG